ncbi:MAG: hypothetical protein U0900_22095 [Myxococcota bacterium]
MKLRTMMAALASCLLAAASASAVDFNATTVTTGGRALNALQVGDTVTVNLRMANPAAVAIFGIGAGAQGWNNAIMRFDSAELGLGKYFCPTVACTTGLDNGVAYPNSDPNTGNFLVGPSDVTTVAGIGNYFPVVQAISTTGRNGTGTRDPGLDGVVNGGDAQFRFVFTAVANGSTTITFGTDPNPTVGNVVVLAGGATEQANNAVLNITVPEPGAVLAGMGALGFAVAAAGLRRRMSI